MFGKSRHLMVMPYYGGKFNHLDFLLPLFPKDKKHLVDVFGGGGSVALNAPFPKVTYNDVNRRLVTFFRVLRDRPDELRRAIGLTPNSRYEYAEAIRWEGWDDLDELEQARRVHTALSQARNSSISERMNHTGWSYSQKGKNRRSWVKNDDDLEEAALILRGRIELENLSWDDILERYDHENVVFYLDPPYLPETRKAKKAYECELSYEEHERMCFMLTKIKSKAVLSGYDSELYNSTLKGWTRLAKKVFASSADGDERHECVWLNYAPEGELGI